LALWHEHDAVPLLVADPLKGWLGPGQEQGQGGQGKHERGRGGDGKHGQGQVQTNGEGNADLGNKKED